MMRGLYQRRAEFVEAVEATAPEVIARPLGDWYVHPGDFKVYSGGVLIDVLRPREFHRRYEAAGDVLSGAADEPTARSTRAAA